MFTKAKITAINLATKGGTALGHFTAELLSDKNGPAQDLYNIDGHVFRMTKNGLEEQHVPDLH